MVKRSAAVLLLGLVLALPGWSDISTAVTLEGLLLTGRNADGDFAATSGTNGSLDFNATGNKNVKGELEIDAFVSDRIIVTIPRAYIKIRFPALRMTIGKTAVSWGKGFLFNAGDVIFDGMSLSADLSQSVLRDNTITQLLVTKYLGSFSYIDLIMLPMPATSEIIPNSGIFLPTNIEIANIAAGARIVFPIGKTSLELGYLYRGDGDMDGDADDASHNPYLGFSSGFFGLGDFYLAASCSVVQGSDDTEAFRDSIKTSAGISISTKAGTDSTLTMRLETGIRPFAGWEEGSSQYDVYGLYIYPEISYAPKDNLSFQLRSIVSPIDGSGIILAGASWNPYQGLTFNLFASAMFGDPSDTFGRDRANDLLFMITVKYIFGN
ncbi:MAG: hypothetical protein JW874_12600 [Spirochaetales bacterium]|nr:hypothetical protein [Spirochaetales bacterium]